MNASMEITLLILIYAFVAAFSLYIFHRLNCLSFLLQLLNVISLNLFVDDLESTNIFFFLSITLRYFYAICIPNTNSEHSFLNLDMIDWLLF